MYFKQFKYSFLLISVVALAATTAQAPIHYDIKLFEDIFFRGIFLLYNFCFKLFGKNNF